MVPCGVLKGMHPADFAGNALFSSSAVIHVEPLPDEFSMDMININRLFSR